MGRSLETLIRLCSYHCLECNWQGAVKTRLIYDAEELLHAAPVNPNEVCPRCGSNLLEDKRRYSPKLMTPPQLPLWSSFAMTPGGAAHDEALWRWILGGDVGPDVKNDSEIVQKRLRLATKGYDLFARSQKTGAVVTVEAWEPPEGVREPFTVLLYRRDTGEMVSLDRLPEDETRKEEVLAYARRFTPVVENSQTEPPDGTLQAQSEE